MATNYSASIVIDGKIQSVNLGKQPKVGETLFFNDKQQYVISSAVNNWTWKHGNTETQYWTCIVREYKPSKVGVKQVKILTFNHYNEIEDVVNDFLYEKRHDYKILEIVHHQCYVAIHYIERTDGDKWYSREKEKENQ